MWQNVSIEQYQRIVKISTSNMPDEEKTTEYLSIILNKTPKQIEDMSIADYNGQCKNMAALFTKDIPGKPQRYIKAGKLYRVNYEVSKTRFAQYVEVKSFVKGGIVENLHLIMASICEPVIDYVIYRKPLKNKSEDHEQRASDMLQAKFIDAYHSAVFFCKLYKNSMNSLQDYLAKQMLANRMTPEQVNISLQALMRVLDGFTPQRR